ncbi:ATP-binding cassette domain-containing protein [Pseudothermotoga sp.]|uniref:ATP-binding cassette domain-containing protein n=2 Tax=Pseudothermotoga TaxID=1643951 RepID=UPI000E8CC3CE|nr:ATP-binding cassette domain-containing protein [Pseudothermotoga sp.]HBJ80337.1 ABC transporter [Pseudothermotoga sp.]
MSHVATLSNVSISFPEKTLFTEFTVNISKKDRIGLMGKNGSGKSTLLKAIAGIFLDYTGQISVSGKILYMDQLRSFNARTPFEYYASTADTPRKLRDVRSILKGFGFEEKDWHRDISTFSGGEKTKLQLGKLFLEEPNFLLLDEPTNFLDVQAIEFLKNLLRKFPGGYIVVAHDRNFLRNVCEKFWEINNGQIWIFDMDFDRHRKERETILKTQERRIENIQKEIDRLKHIIDQYRRWNREKFFKQAKSREKLLNKMYEELENMPNLYLQEEEKNIKIPIPDNTGHVVLEVIDVSWNSLLKKINFTVYQKDKIAIIGPNGSGKTTLLKIITGHLRHNGTIKIGHNVKMVFVDQFISQLDPENTVFDEIFEEMPDHPDYVIRSYAGRFGFKGENVFKQISQLSGGERQILAIAKILLRKPNLLILDEPTNHMDLQTVEALEKALKEYEGSVLLVSHDLELVSNVCNRFFSIINGEIVEVDSPVILFEKKPTISKTKNRPFEEKKKLRNQLKNLQEILENLSKKEEDLCGNIEQIDNKLSLTNDYNEITSLIKEKEKLEQDLLTVMEEMQKTREKIENLQAHLSKF